MSNDLGYTLTRNNDIGMQRVQESEHLLFARFILSRKSEHSVATLCYRKLNYYAKRPGITLIFFFKKKV